MARVRSAAHDVAAALARASVCAGVDGNRRVGVSARTTSCAYAEGYFAGLCFALATLQDLRPEVIAEQLLDAHRPYAT